MEFVTHTVNNTRVIECLGCSVSFERSAEMDVDIKFFEAFDDSLIGTFDVRQDCLAPEADSDLEIWILGLDVASSFETCCTSTSNQN
jgi:hypothetical protein